MHDIYKTEGFAKISTRTHFALDIEIRTYMTLCVTKELYRSTCDLHVFTSLNTCIDLSHIAE